MNSFYHPREHDQEGHAHSRPYDASSLTNGHEGHQANGGDSWHTEQTDHTPHVAHAEHSSYLLEDAAQGTDAESPVQGPEHSEKDLGLYQVLLAVERGELSPEDAARKLEELEAGGKVEGGPGPI